MTERVPSEPLRTTGGERLRCQWPPLEMPVLVAGGGASGLVISIVLAGHGVGSLVVGPTDRLELTLLGHARTFGCIEIRPAAELVSFEVPARTSRSSARLAMPPPPRMAAARSRREGTNRLDGDRGRAAGSVGGDPCARWVPGVP